MLTTTPASTRLQRLQARAWPWLALLCVLIIEQALDVATTALGLPLGAQEHNPFMRLLYADGGAPALAAAKAVYVLILTILMLYFIRTPKARTGPYAALALLSSLWTALLYAWILVGNIMQLAAYVHP